jgi:phosphoenolpyruvate synthase/pyruvate phosphate dikinase
VLDDVQRIELARLAIALEDAMECPGYPASPGIVVGRASVVHSLAEAAKVKPGDVLVAETTMPPWAAFLARSPRS